jgi:hypothetical protein
VGITSRHSPHASVLTDPHHADHARIAAARHADPHHAPPRFKLEHELPVGARRETWATVADVCAAALSGLDDPVHRWLVRQLLQYLQEEGLSQSSLTPDDINVLPASIRAFAALDGLIELTAEAMEDAWGPRLSPRRRGQTIDVEFTYEPRPRAARKADSKTAGFIGPSRRTIARMTHTRTHFAHTPGSARGGRN